jgi:lipopolysaccharide/colanic/teichoic acid biosynthesis glycosyltransferase
LRKDIEKHERHDCNEAPATCEYEPVGCNQDKVIRTAVVVVAVFACVVQWSLRVCVAFVIRSRFLHYIVVRQKRRLRLSCM